MLVGHNPAIQGLAITLARTGDRRADLVAHYPTGALAELEFDTETWSDVAEAGAVLTRFVLPRELPRP
jgi:phosphohistidine phosphatase